MLAAWIALILAMAACGQGSEPPPPTPTLPPPSPTPIPVPSLDPYDWLMSIPFVPPPAEPPRRLETGLPAGFVPIVLEVQSGELPGGGMAWMYAVEYRIPDDGQVDPDDVVRVAVCSHESLEARGNHLRLLFAEAYVFLPYVTIDGQVVAAYDQQGVTGRMWVSGPYLILVMDHPDKTRPSEWLDQFTALYLREYPVSQP